MDIKEIVKNWAKQINLSKHKEEQTKIVLKEIDNLLEDNKVTEQERKDILKELYQLLSLPPRLKNGQFILLEQFENKYYLQMIKNAISFIDGDKDSKEINKQNEKN